MTPAEKAMRTEYLRESGWIRVSASGSQTWRDPDETGTWTLCAAVKYVSGRAGRDGKPR